MKILFYGFGNIAIRHFESLSTIEGIEEYYFFDKNLKKAKLIKKRYKDLKIKLIKNIDSLKKTNFFLIINSTTANCRYAILQKIKKLNPENVLVEKILENDISNLRLMKKEKYVNFYVNFPYRMTAIFKLLKKKINFKNVIKFKVKTINWNLASNSIHYIDFFSYIFKKNPHKIYCKNLKKFRSKRIGYVDFEGKILANFKNFKLEIINILDESNKEKTVKFEIFLNNKKKIFYKIEDKVIKLYSQIYKTKFDYQSSLTKIFYLQLLKKKKINLPLLSNHIDLNIMYLKSFTKNKKIMIT